MWVDRGAFCAYTRAEVGCSRFSEPIGEPGGDDTFRLIVSHQDQVVSLPPGAEVTAYNGHCDYAALRIGDHIMTFQGHPEFVPSYSREIMALRREQIGMLSAAGLGLAPSVGR